MVKTLRLIDTHSHPQMGDYDADREAVLQRSFDQGIGLIAVGTTLIDSLAGVKLADRYPDQPIWAAVGIHPTDEDLENIHPTQLESLLDTAQLQERDPANSVDGMPPRGKIVAIGETGLDYFHVNESQARDLQADIFEQHILLAQQTDLPLIVHCRDRRGVSEAYDNALTLLTRHQVGHFVMHCYSGDWARAEKFLELGGYLSFTGIITFPKIDLMQDIVKKTPLDRLMIETDAPFLAPEPHRGKRNEPAYVELVARTIAALRGQPFEVVALATTNNAVNFFGLKKTPTG